MPLSNAAEPARVVRRAPPPALPPKPAGASQALPPSSARMRLIAIGASSATITTAQPKAKTVPSIRSPHISMGQTLRAAIVLCIACLPVAFPPLGLRKATHATATVVDVSVEAAHPRL
jgi:hypothetical protein